MNRPQLKKEEQDKKSLLRMNLDVNNNGACIYKQFNKQCQTRTGHKLTDLNYNNEQVYHDLYD